MNVLIIKMSSMGDVIHTLPALTDAMNAIPGIGFDWVVEEAFAEIPTWHPAVNNVIPVALRRWRRSPLSALLGGEWRRYRRSLRARHYDAVIDAQGLTKSSLMATRLARGPSFGLDRASAREPFASSFYGTRIAVAKGQHAVERTRQLFAKALGYEIDAGRGDYAIAPAFRRAGGVPRLVFVHAASRADKLWPESCWIELAGLGAEAGYEIDLLWGSTEERERAERIAAASPNARVLPRLPLGDIAQVLVDAEGVVSVDTGLSHLAAALGRPNVVLFGPTDPGLVGGYGERQLCLSARDFASPAQSADPTDLALLAPETVWQSLRGLLMLPGEDAAAAASPARVG